MVLRSGAGDVLTSEGEVAKACEEFFLQEFGGNGALAELGTTPTDVAFIADGIDRSPWPCSREELAELVWARTSRICPGRTCGPDLFSPEVLKFGGDAATQVLSTVLLAVKREGGPTA